MFELLLVPDDGSVQELVAERPYPSFGEGVRLRRTWRDSNGGDARCCEHGVVGAGELSGSVSDQASERMVVSESPFLVVCSMTNRTWKRLSIAVSTQAKSVAMIALDCERMNCAQVGPVRSRVGSIPAARRIFQTVDAAMAWPTRSSSPWMRR